MPRVRRSRTPKAPEGFELVKPTLDDFAKKMREAENDPHENKRKAESVWSILQIHHQQSRYVYDIYYRRKEISRELYEWLLDEKYADRNLIAKWKKPGYERVCCLRCIQTKDHAFGTTCICRVPKSKLESGKIVECLHCGCHGCASGD
eukprot:CAMPEP_0201520730 /NCGR_PEP_ID=MMETSP0161_2-20130828/12323_1 /ASSEMBLY_ACC=CAM_ASM_000251 /TAXON_ID=180227 /ORGANISM="Neoparamoeba aestuarina, Strain SoJaBio B1-5/56/2" /LENGTH=147 /DNA_ID=CAMNT_0047919203 /DNA_START=106 /DNA_END=549 /DNA_ORIENTATION=-